VTPLLKRLSWALALSVGLNVFLLGFGTARWFQRRAHSSVDDAPRGPRGTHGIFGAPTPELRAKRSELRAARGQVGEALESEPFDRERMEEALANLREKTADGQRELHEHLLQRISTLPLEQRKRFAKSRYFREGPHREGD
jgi:uncharacterized membrane protein